MTIMICLPYVGTSYKNEHLIYANTKIEDRGSYKSYTVWHPETEIKFGRINNHMEALDKPHKSFFSRYDSGERASAALVSWLYPKLCARLRKGAEKGRVQSLFTPKFLYDTSEVKDGAFVFTETREQTRYENLIGDDIFVSVYVSPFEWPELDKSTMREHNERLSLEKKVLKRFVLRQHKIIRDTPLMWIPCSTLARWLSEMEREKPDCWKELSKDTSSLGRFRVWRAQLQAFGAMRAKAILVYS